MMGRCYLPKKNNYHNYGGRGIKVCKRWHTFENFYEDMGERPTDKHSLERVDNEGGYHPDNCCWALQDTQLSNKRTNHLITYNGETKTITNWSRYVNIHVNTLYYRLKLGWSVEDTLTRKPKKGRNQHPHVKKDNYDS
jgi:hypothetical protein